MRTSFVKINIAHSRKRHCFNFHFEEREYVSFFMKFLFNSKYRFIEICVKISISISWVFDVKVEKFRNEKRRVN